MYLFNILKIESTLGKFTKSNVFIFYIRKTIRFLDFLEKTKNFVELIKANCVA